MPSDYNRGSFFIDCTQELVGNQVRGRCGPNTRLTDGITNLGSPFDSSNFIGWNNAHFYPTVDFNFTSPTTLRVNVTQIDIYFYHHPTEGYGIDDIAYMYSFDGRVFHTLPSTFGDNSKLSQTDNKVQKVSMYFPPLSTKHQFSGLLFYFFQPQVINQIFISEIVSFNSTSKPLNVVQ